MEFYELYDIINWLFDEIYKLFTFLWEHSYWVGIAVIGLPLLRKVVDIFRRLF
ncbi:hypothetical protein [Clostridium porci]|uniref:hypothetical protein n=1 Tax=Clostridium porci TaxID=2605778 RepID=UPI0018A6ADC8|nr:hypothetical protein [Clostridium porci]